MSRARHSKEEPFRRLLRLPAERPEPSGYVWTDDRDDGLLGHEKVGPEEHRRHRLAWHAEGWRGQLANSLAYGPHRARQRLVWKLEAPYEKWLRWRARRALAIDRTLRYTSHYISTHDTTGIEGYFDFDGNVTFALDIYTPSAMKAYAEMEWEWMKDLVTSENSLVFGSGRWVVAPSETLTEDVIRETLLHWYKERFEYVRGHWSQVEETLPKIILDLGWESDEERAEREAYIAEAEAEANAETPASA